MNQEIITNLTQWLWNEELSQFLTVHGFSDSGSDYRRLQKLCVCCDRAPSSPVARWLQAEAKELTGKEIVFSKQNTNVLWKLTADWLFEASDYELRMRETRPILTAQDVFASAPDLPALRPFSINAMQIQGLCWEEWEAQAIKQLHALETDQIPTVMLPKEFQPTKADRYHVDLHLSQRERNDHLWHVQLLYFLCKICLKYGIRGGVILHCDASKFFDVLQNVCKITELPPMFLWSDGIDPNFYLAASQWIADHTVATVEGVPPLGYSMISPS